MLDSTTISKTSERSEFADLIEAFRDYFHGDAAQWRIGELLNDYCGPPGANGRHNGSSAKIAEVRKALIEAFGDRAEFDSSYIERWRTIAHAFPPPKRLGGIGWSLHSIAGNPEILWGAKAEADRSGEKLTKGFLDDYKARLKDKHKSDWARIIDELSRLSVLCEEYSAWLKNNRPAEDLSESLAESRQRLLNAVRNIEERLP
jgi:hypothetical protein